MASNTPHKPKKTEPGLGIPRINTAEVSRVQGPAPDGGFVPESTGSRRLRDTLRREEDADVEQPVSQRTEKSPRPTPVTVDKVGDGAVKLARGIRKNAPHRVTSKVAIEKAPLDARSAFLLSLVDGDNTVEALVDMSGMSEQDVKSILGRLVRLGLIALP
jgi:hypothetical protein